MISIRDGVYEDYIELNENEANILSSEPVQRLRRVNQLGLSSLVYPSANHSRFEHSLGAMYLAGCMANSLSLDDSERRAYRIGALLHDTGHAPFSHAIERLVEERLGESHEDKSCELVNAIEDSIPVDSGWVKDIIKGESEYNIVAGDVDVDRMDYLRRDSQRTGLQNGRIDTATLINFSEISDSDDWVFSHKCLQALDGFFHSRFEMTKSVYSHHTSKIAESMLERAVDSYIESNSELEQLIRWDDYQLHTHLIESDGTSKELYSRISNRNLYKRAVFLSDVNYTRRELIRLEKLIDNRRDTEKEIADIAGVDENKVIVDPPRTPGEIKTDVLVNNHGTIQPFHELSSISTQLEEVEWRNTILGVYTPAEHVTEVREAATDVLELTIQNDD